MAYNPYNPGYVNQGYTAPQTTGATTSTGIPAPPTPTTTNNPVSASPTVAAKTATMPNMAAPKLPTTTLAASTKKPVQSALDKWLAGDTDYQQQVAEFNQQQQAYQQQYDDSVNQQNQNYNATKTGMNTQATTDRQNQQYDFAGRGVLQSGVYAQALDQYNTTFNQNMNNLTQGNTQALGSDQDQLNNFLRELTLQKNAAKQDAIRRRAETLGI